jgi:hypothetical protein
VDTYAFTLLISGDAGTDERIDALFDAGCDDATFSHSATISYGDFDREAASLLDALLSAIRAVESVEGLVVRRVETDDLVTLPQIAERLGRTRQSVHQLVNGDRGEGDFPAPVASARGKGKVWDWADVAAWGDVAFDHERAETIAAVNGALSLRAARSTLTPRRVARLLRFAAA